MWGRYGQGGRGRQEQAGVGLPGIQVADLVSDGIDGFCWKFGQDYSDKARGGWDNAGQTRADGGGSLFLRSILWWDSIFLQEVSVCFPLLSL